jgi:hypothetical protein
MGNFFPGWLIAKMTIQCARAQKALFQVWPYSFFEIGDRFLLLLNTNS